MSGSSGSFTIHLNAKAAREPTARMVRGQLTQENSPHGRPASGAKSHSRGPSGTREDTELDIRTRLPGNGSSNARDRAAETPHCKLGRQSLRFERESFEVLNDRWIGSCR
jgi:hypothetical protein